MSNQSNLLKDIAVNVQLKLLADLAQSRPIEHSGTKGDITEAAWISLFRDYLPTRFRMAKGIVVDCNGKTSQQIDCVIFDAQYTPQIIPNEASLYIPSEAVHAVFEVKQEINSENIAYASEKVESVRALARTSTPYVGDGQTRKAKSLFAILGGLLALRCGYQDKLASDSFLNKLDNLTDDGWLDFVFSAEDGYADLIKSKGLVGSDKNYQVRNGGEPFIVEGEAGISYGLIRLLEELSWQGTVQAVEWSKYLANLATPKTIKFPKRA